MTMLLLIAGCGRSVTETDVKMAGVGLDPDEIGPAPEYYGGLVELDYVQLAGGGLSLGALGLQSYDEVGPGFNGFAPPFVAIYGLSFIFDDLVPAPDAHHGSIGIPPDVMDSCWTTSEPFSYLLASTVELGDQMVVSNEAGDVVLPLGRVPELYPADPQDVFVYYSTVAAWVAEPMTNWTPDGNGGTEQTVLRPKNWGFNETVSLSFKGGLPPVEAPVSSIPLPSASVGDPEFLLPAPADNLWVSWEGPYYSNDPDYASDGGEHSTCVRYHPGGKYFTGQGTSQEVNDDFAVSGAIETELDCTTWPDLPSGDNFATTGQMAGQLYTGPWDTEDGVTFHWNAADSADDVVLNIRFLGPVDRTADTFKVPRVALDAPPEIDTEWNKLVDRDTVTGAVPDGFRAALACDTELGEVDDTGLGEVDDPRNLEWVFDPALEKADGTLIDSLRGDPTYNMVEVSCRLEDDGEFTLTNSHLANGLRYASEHGAEGALFYFSRSTESDAQVPDVRDQAGFRRDINPIKIRANAVTVGRFWIDDVADLAVEN
ncbi:MAG: hypothetical protein GY913_25895 [Proteobacteria bacterium]|nr:hypothetical protein [Pseudomonadota bacterium]MCP4920349.1 hypothetical protein [Pseudomonadota bacterium]